MVSSHPPGEYEPLVQSSAQGEQSSEAKREPKSSAVQAKWVSSCLNAVREKSSEMSCVRIADHRLFWDESVSAFGCADVEMSFASAIPSSCLRFACDLMSRRFW